MGHRDARPPGHDIAVGNVPPRRHSQNRPSALGSRRPAWRRPEAAVAAEHAYKGDMGRVGVVGGSQEYSGAPYFAAISALRLGADLSHVFTTKNAASVIKTYSPELIVHQLLHESDERTDDDADRLAQKAEDDVTAWFNRLDALVVGPGLGQDPLNSQCAKRILRSARDRGLSLVLDADSLYLVTKDRELVQGCANAVLTPNVNELRRLAQMLQIPTVDLTPQAAEVREHVAIEVARALAGPTIVSKGAFDVVTNGDVAVRCTELSTARRCGGQGDVLSGAIAVIASWAKRAVADITAPPLLAAAYAACAVTRRAAQLTFRQKGRSMVAGDMILRLTDALDSLYDSSNP